MIGPPVGRRWWRTAGAVVVLLATSVLGAGPAVAQQEAGVAPGRGFEIYSGSVGFGVDTGIGTSDTSVGDLLGESLLFIVPGAAAYTRNSRTSSLEFIYEPDFEVFGKDNVLNAWNHAAAARYTGLLNRQWRVAGGGSFLQTMDRSRQSFGLTLAPRGQFTEGRGFGELGYVINADSVIGATIDVLYTDTPFLGLSTGLETLREMTYSAGVFFSRNLGPSHTVGVSYAYLRRQPLDSDLSEIDRFRRDQGRDLVSGSYTWRNRTGLQLLFSGGVIRARPVLGLTGNEYTYSMSARVDKKWRQTTLSGGYIRNLTGLLRLAAPDTLDQVRDPLLSTTVAQTLDMQLTTGFGRRVRLDGGAQYVRTDSPSGPGFADRVESVYGAANLTIIVVPRLAPYVGITYWRQTNPEFDFPAFSRSRIVGGVRFSLRTLFSSVASIDNEPARSILPIRRVR